MKLREMSEYEDKIRKLLSLNPGLGNQGKIYKWKSRWSRIVLEHTNI